MELTLAAAKALRDGGIDAMAALDSMLGELLPHLPEALHSEMKRTTGRLMGAVMEETLDKARDAFPELEPDEQTWRAVVRRKALARSADR